MSKSPPSSPSTAAEIAANAAAWDAWERSSQPRQRSPQLPGRAKRIIWTEDVRSEFAAIACAATAITRSEVGAVAVTKYDAALAAFVVSRMIVPRQTCSSTSLTFDQKDFNERVAAMFQDGTDDAAHLRGWIHAHPGSGPQAAFLSGTDNDTIDAALAAAFDSTAPASSGAVWYVSIVTDCNGEHPYGRLDILHPRASVELPVVVQQQRGCSAAAEALVRERMTALPALSLSAPLSLSASTSKTDARRVTAAPYVPYALEPDDARDCDDVFSVIDKVATKVMCGVMTFDDGVRAVAADTGVDVPDAVDLLGDALDMPRSVWR